MNINYFVFPITEQSQYTDEKGQLNQFYKQQFKDKIVPPEQGLPQDQVIKSPGRVIQLDSVYEGTFSQIPVYYDKSFQYSDNYLIQFHMNSDDLGDVFRTFHMFTSQANGLNFNVLAMEQPGQGTYKNSTITEDLLTHNATLLQDFVKDQFKVPDENIQLQGRSIGTCLALKLASLRKPRAVIVVSPILSISNIVKQQLGNWFQRLVKEQFNSTEYLKKIKSNVQIIHGELDKTVQVRNAYQIHDQNKSLFDIQILPGLAHINIPNSLILELITDWLSLKRIYDKSIVMRLKTEFVEFPKKMQKQVSQRTKENNWCICSNGSSSPNKYQSVLEEFEYSSKVNEDQSKYSFKYNQNENNSKTIL